MENQNNFLPIFLQEERNNEYVVDWITEGKTLRFFNRPPKVPEDITCYADGLRTTVAEKLQIALTEQERLERLRKKRIQMVLNYIPKKNQWFYLLLEQHLFIEYFIISKWVRYWLNIWGKVEKSYIPPVRSYKQFSELEIQQAKGFPIERLYQGELRQSGKRLIGQCVFHQERTPSFFIFQETNTWYCFGACSSGGDAINFAMKLFDITFPVAVRRLLYG